MFLKNYKWALLWALFIFILCAIPGKDIPNVSWLAMLGIDKFIHAALFFFQIAFLINASKNYLNLEVVPTTQVTLLVIISIVYGGLLELMQGAFYTDRTADIYDFMANFLGVMSGVLFLKWRSFN